MRLFARTGLIVCSVAAVCTGAYLAGQYLTLSLQQPTEITSASSVHRSVVEFLNTTDKETRVQAVRATKEAFLQATTSIDRAHTLNVLVGMAHAVHEEYVYEEIFTGPPFDRFATDDQTRSLDDLAIYSFSIYPTAYAAQISVYANRHTIYDAFFNVDQAVDRVAMRKKYEPNFRRILWAYEEAEKWIGRDVMDATTPEEALTTLVVFYQWQGHLLSDLAIGDPGYFEAAQRDLEKGILYAKSMRDTNGKTLPYLDSKIAEMQLSIASYSAERGKIYGQQELIDRGRTYSEEVVRRLRSEPEKYNLFYTLLKLEKESQEAERAGNHIQHTVHERNTLRPFWRFELLATIDPSMKDFLQEFGLTLRENKYY